MQPTSTDNQQPPARADHPPDFVGVPINDNRSNVVVPQQQFLQESPSPWSTGLCHCFSNFQNCCITWWCPCITFGQVSEIVDRGTSSCGSNGAIYTLISLATGCGCIYSCFYRSKMRRQYMLKESPCGDCLVHCCCESCALCQEYRELEARGFDMSIGWHANVEKQFNGVQLAPTTAAGMIR